MSKVKHLLRKLHIGDHHHHGRPPPAALDPSPQAPTQPSTSSLSSPSSELPLTVSSLENDSSRDNFSFFEEEFEMQLALAISVSSVSDPGQIRVDSETAEINAVKQISLGCSPTQSLPEFLSLRYWSSNVVDYDEKVLDGFYDVCGIDSNLAFPAKMPSLVDLETIPAQDDVGYDVILVNRSIDLELRRLEEIVYCMTLECRALDKGLNTSVLVQKIANLIAERMGGPVSDVEEMLRMWRVKNRDLKISLNSIILPIGSLAVGHSRQRALLFKVLADRVNLPCKLVKGSYYTGTDEGAVNLIKLENGSEYIIDLMGAPGTLIPAEVPSCHHQNFGLDARSIFGAVGIDKSPLATSDNGDKNKLSSTSADETINIRSSILESSRTAIDSNRNRKKTLEKTRNEQLPMRTGDNYLTPIGDVLNSYTMDAESKSAHPEGISASEAEDLLPSSQSQNFREKNFLEGNALMRRETVDNQLHPWRYLPKDEQFILTSAGINFMKSVSHNSNKNESTEGFGSCQFLNESAGDRSSVNTSNDHAAFFRNRNEDVASNSNAATCRQPVDLSGNNASVVTCCDQSGAGMIQNVQMNPVLNGISEILWEELQIGERIGIGSYGEVYRADWNGTEVAVKKFMKQDFSGDALAQFKCEIEIMLRLRHPNVVLFMGAVTRPPHMSILTEYLPRGSLYKLLHRPNIQIDEKRRIKMALDVAKGMNYLHTSSPIIVHRDLKTPNLLVDKNWVVKVCDFGMSRLQHHTYLSSKSTAGTAEWMAPEVLRNEPSNEKSDVYSFGVILWELATLRVPWTEMNSMQVVGAVGFQDRHLDIPSTVDPVVAEIISECWNRNPQARPSFAQIITRIKGLHRLTLQRMESRTYQQ